LSRIEVHLLKGLIEAIEVKSCWLHAPARPDFVEPCFTPNTYRKDVSSKIAFGQGFDDDHHEPGSNVMSFSHHVLN